MRIKHIKSYWNPALGIPTDIIHTGFLFNFKSSVTICLLLGQQIGIDGSNKRPCEQSHAGVLLVVS